MPRAASRALGVILAFLASLPALSQTLRVDATPAHTVNRFVPEAVLGAGIDRIPVEAIDKDFTPSALDKAFAAGWHAVSYRQNTELAVEAWHWNPEGTWSGGGEKGYFTGRATLGKPIRYSFGFGLPRRGVTRNDGTGNAGYSRITDGDPKTFWKSNPYLSEAFTGEKDARHPQWVIVDLAQTQSIDSIRIAWSAPYARKYRVQYWTGDDPIKAPTRATWVTFPRGEVEEGHGGTETLRLAAGPLPVRFARILMTESSNSCTEEGAGDKRNCVGFAMSELFLGTTTVDGLFHDVMRHTPDQEQTTTYCSSVDPWHRAADLTTEKEAQVGLDLFYTSGVTRGAGAMVPVSLLYDTPENSRARRRSLVT